MRALAQAFEGADGVFHVAGWYKIGDRHPEEAWRVNVDGTRNALAAAAQTGVPRVVHTSTVAVNPIPEARCATRRIATAANT